MKFSDMLERDPSVALIVDSMNLAFRWKHSGKLKFCDEFIKTVQSLAQSYKAGTIIIAADWGASSYRRNILPEYKGNRVKDQTPEEKEAFEKFFLEYEKTIATISEKYPTFRFKGVEADDIAAHIVKEASTYGYDSIWLISSDKDWDLLVSDSVSRFSYVTRKEVCGHNWDEHYTINQDMYLTYKCLVGDKGDNVAGVPGIGEVRAAKIIKELGDVFEIIDSLPLPGKAKYISALNESEQLLYKNIELMDLLTYCDEAIGEENIQEIRTRLLGV